MGYIYIMTNPSFEEYVKIGYAKNVKQRLDELNRSSAVPLAEYIKDELNADIYEIEAKVPYTDDDIKYYTDCRADKEQKDPSARPEIAGELPDLSKYDTVYLGYPIWHGQAPKIIYTFLESIDVSGKTVIPFCTSGSSPVGSSAGNLHPIAPDAVWKDGTRFAAGTSREEIKEWLKQYQ